MSEGFGLFLVYENFLLYVNSHLIYRGPWTYVGIGM